MRPPRRIFRSSLSARTGRAGRTALVWAGLLAGGTALATVSLSSSLFGRAQPGPERIEADASQVAVVDGETLRLSGQVVRLAGVEAPSRGDHCRNGADCGGAATSMLASLVRDRRIDCRLNGRDGMGRPFAACDAGGQDLSRALVASGWARAQSGSPALADLELRARRQGSGLWGQGTTAQP